MLDKNSFQGLLILFFMFLALQTQAARSCEEALSEENSGIGRLKTVGVPVAPYSETYTAFDIRGAEIDLILRGEMLPNWNHYNWIVNLRNLARASKLSAAEAKSIRKTMAQLFKNFDKRDGKTKYVFVDKAYRFFEILDSISQIEGFRAFKYDYLKFAPTDAELIEQGKKTVEANVQRLREKYQLSGFKNTTELVNAIQGFGEFGEKALELANSQNIVTIRRPEGARFWVPISGFQNQRVTGNSKGSFNPEFRDSVESSLTFQNPEDFRNYSVRYKPSYGEARTEIDAVGPVFKSYAHSYGADCWILKKEIVEARATFTPSDSFNQPRAIGGQQTLWDQLFIPWIHREFLAAYLLSGLKNGVFYPSSPPSELKLTTNGYPSRYFEVQVWGPVTIRDVEAFAFSGTPPDAEFLRTLRSYGIKVWDMRKAPAKLYNETEE